MDIQELHAEWSKLFQTEQNLELQKGRLLQELHKAFKQEPNWPKNWQQWLRGVGLTKTRAYRLMEIASFYQDELPL